MQPTEDLLHWLALSFVTGVGSRTAARLLDKFGSPVECFRANILALEIADIKRDIIEQLKSVEPLRRAEREINELAKLGGVALTLTDARYPALLRETYDPPIVLYALGNLTGAFDDSTLAPGISIVGSRRCSTYGRNAAEMLARELAARGITIVSGLARGIDAAAHSGALDGRGRTVAVMGTGLDDIYPKEHKRLAERIKADGVLLTEFPLGSPPLPQNFPFRNRIISGIALGVMVVEGAERSGSLITARLAMEQNREVFAVPGNITSAKSFGPNYLIKDGAKLVQTWRDVVEELPAELRAQIYCGEPGNESGNGHLRQLPLDAVALSDIERRVLNKLQFDCATHIDDLLLATRLPIGELMTALTTLEMADRIRQLPGKHFSRKL